MMTVDEVMDKIDAIYDDLDELECQMCKAGETDYCYYHDSYLEIADLFLQLAILQKVYPEAFNNISERTEGVKDSISEQDSTNVPSED